jgi:alanyl-tRNA synthetase
MTERLFDRDAYLTEFDATVLSAEHVGDRTIVVLDRTAFYPTSGGQPSDTGTLGGLPIADVVEEEGSIAHVLGAATPAEAGAGSGVEPTRDLPGRVVHGVVDWPRRFDHMQQHTGQHVLSAAFDRVFGARTVGFHLGAETSTIDLAKELRPNEVAAVEDTANRIVWEDRPIAVRFVTTEEAAQLSLRKEPQREGTLRIVEIPEFDLSACGGTHVARTGAIGAIVIASWERCKGGLRVEFVCGARALARIRSLRGIAASAMTLLSVAAADIPAAIERMQAEARDQRHATAGLQRELARYRAQELFESGAETPVGRLVLRAVDMDASGLKALATAVVANGACAAVLVSASTPALAVVARSVDGTIQANQVLAALTKQFGGRGGGKADLAQGGGLNGPPQAILDAARAAILG